jgi:hypothetical protein
MPDGSPRILAGRIVDARGEPLARHVVRLLAPDAEDALAQLKPEIEATSGADGLFELQGITVGTKLLQLFGVGEGDLPILVSGQHVGDAPRVAYKVEEGSLWLVVPPAGLDGMEFVGPRHASFWVQGQLEFERRADAPPDESPRIDPQGITMREVPPAWGVAEGPWPARDFSSLPASPNSVELLWPSYWRVSGPSFLVGADAPTDTLLVVTQPGYATQSRTVPNQQLFNPAGTISLTRVAGLEVEVLGAYFHRHSRMGQIELRETGGDLPDRVTLHTMSWHLEGGERLWSERRTGHYQLRVTAPGYTEWTASGDLVLSDELPVVRAELKPAR